ncbi:hypothetical protein [Dyella choica]|uniref:Uncharacterized protein n=1 Tax=Dyella choica TaxID=1927959 RepID=A0A432M7Y2_9GAMM|nr:hypothetical protein [Dyella choica]RUL77631.1 hypothetical protein EKH80_07080 [Dyella choica]
MSKKTRTLWLALACLLALYEYVHAAYAPKDTLQVPQSGGVSLHYLGIQFGIQRVGWDGNPSTGTPRESWDYRPSLRAA